MDAVPKGAMTKCVRRWRTRLRNITAKILDDALGAVRQVLARCRIRGIAKLQKRCYSVVAGSGRRRVTASGKRSAVLKV